MLEFLERERVTEALSVKDYRENPGISSNDEEEDYDGGRQQQQQQPTFSSKGEPLG